MKKKTLEFLTDAQADLDGAVDWYLERDRFVAQSFVAEVQRAIALVFEAPHRWPVYEDELRRKLVGGFPFAIIYENAETSIVVVAIAHTSRRPSYWRHR